MPLCKENMQEISEDSLDKGVTDVTKVSTYLLIPELMCYVCVQVTRATGARQR